MLELVPASWLGRSFSIERDGQQVAQIDLRWLRERGELTIKGAPYRLDRAGILRGTFTLAQMGQAIAVARQPSMMRDRYELNTAEGHVYELVNTSWWSGAFSLREQGREIGSVRRHNSFSRRAAIAMPEQLSLPVAVFAVTLVILSWNRKSAAASG